MNQGVLIRADATTRMGTGHVMRCLALAQTWQDEGGDVLFACNEITPTLRMRLTTENVRIRGCTVCSGSLEDADFTVGVARETGANWVVVDGYQFGAEYQRRLKDGGLKVLFIDDFGHASCYCADLVLNQNLGPSETTYSAKAPSTKLLLGTRYALLRREFLGWSDWHRQIPERASTVLVTLGGADPDNVTLKAVEALRQISTPGLQAIVVVGGSNPHQDQLRGRIGEADKMIRLMTDVSDMPKLMAWADVAIAAGGSSSWERALLGLPSLILVLADNECTVSEAIDNIGIGRNLGCGNDVRVDTITGELIRLMKSSTDRRRMSDLARQLVDGQGAQRVVAQMKGQSLRLRRVRPGDCEIIWKWRNEPAVRELSFNSDPVPWEKHMEWYESQLNAVDVYFYMGVDERDEPVGQIRFKKDGASAVVSVTIAPERRGKGCGAELIRLATRRLFRNRPDVRVVQAYIKAGNESSRRAFERAGFTERQDVIEQGAPAMLLSLRSDGL